MDYWYDQSEGDQGNDDSAEALAWQRQFDARADARVQRLASGGAAWVTRQTDLVRHRKQELNRSHFWGSVAAALASGPDDGAPVELVCYGLGELDSASGSYQLALLLLLADELQIAPGCTHCFDPVHTPQEEAVLERCGCQPLRHDEQAMRACAVPTLFFMPHCPYALYNNLVWANWAALWRVTIIGNDLGFHALHNHPFETVAPHLHQTMRIADTARLPDTFTPSEEDSNEGGDGAEDSDMAVISSRQIFGLSFPSQDEWEGAEDGDPLATWLREERPALPTAENFAERLERELEETKARVAWLERRLARERAAGTAARL